MIEAANMIILGAAGRNVGKTEFACELIRRYSETDQVIAVKITTVKERDGKCPRGGQGCGVCSSLKDNFCLTEETTTGSGKDTSRMKEAGAQRVLWLRVLYDHLEEGVKALMQTIPAMACVICESNSARLVIKPGVFLVIKEADSVLVKDSCAAVIAHADRQLQFFGNHWDLGPDKCKFHAGRWSVPLRASGAVLAGGQSRRMGQDKSLLPIQGMTMIEHIIGQLRPHVEELMISSGFPEKYHFTGLPVIADEQPDMGPLMGILSCLQAAHYEIVFITACDIPVIPAALIRQMLHTARDHDIVMAVDSEGRHEPLLAVYSRRLIPAARAILNRGGRRIIELFNEPDVRVAFISIPPGDWFHNLNSPADYQKINGL